MALRHALIVAAALTLSGGPAFAQATDMSTAPPKAPTYPVPAKPDFTPVRYLLGSWTCVSHSQRRGSETSKSTSVTTLTPDGYWMKSVSKSAGTSYAKYATTFTDWVTYDSNTKRWVDIGMGSFGGYGYSSSTGPDKYGRTLWTAEAFMPDGDSTSTTGTLQTKISDTKYTTAGAFTTAAGLVNNVSSTCTKS